MNYQSDQASTLLNNKIGWKLAHSKLYALCSLWYQQSLTLLFHSLMTKILIILFNILENWLITVWFTIINNLCLAEGNNKALKSSSIRL